MDASQKETANQTRRVLLALVAGLVAGALVENSGSPELRSLVGVVEPLGTMWINAIRMTVVPLVLALVINGIAGTSHSQSIGKLGLRLFLLFLGLLTAGTLLAVVLGVPLMGALSIAPDVAGSLRAGAESATATAAPAMPTFMERIVQTIPVNPIRAAADAAMLPLVVFAVLFATALRKMDADRREPIVGLFAALGEAMLVLVRWVLVVAPVGIFALALGLGMRMGASAAGALLHYVVVFCIVLVVYMLLLYPAVRLLAGVPIRRFMAAVAPAQGIALSSRASLTALPALITGARDQLNAPPHVTGFVLPLAMSVLRASAPVAWILGVLFLGKLYGIAIEPFDLAKVFALGIFLSFSVPGIPSASLFLLSPLLVDMGFPAGAVGILIAVDAIPDMFKTALNVTAHMAVAAVVSGKVGTDPDQPPPAQAASIAA